jgi:hypothetical protein
MIGDYHVQFGNRCLLEMFFEEENHPHGWASSFINTLHMLHTLSIYLKKVQ